MTLRICSIVGARPQFVKAGAVSRAVLRDRRIEESLIHTGQHYDANMSEVFFREFDLPEPRHNIGVGSGSHGAQTAHMIEGLERVFLEEKPRVVLVYGDTNSTLAGALAATKLHIPVAHVEAGLRSFNRRMPEEINRIVADAVADVLYAPSAVAAGHLRREGVSEDKIVTVGDVMYDASLMTAELARDRSEVMARLGLTDGGFYVATVHRAENTDDPTRLRTVFRALQLVAQRVPVVLPLHPRTRAALTREGLLEAATQSLILTEPVGFVDLARLEMGARAVITDSGGVQKEAFFHRRPCFTLRDETEWVELVELGWNRLLPPVDAEYMAATMLDLASFAPREGAPYGNGRAAETIVGDLVARFGA